jgi:hypothetical protein
MAKEKRAKVGDEIKTASQALERLQRNGDIKRFIGEHGSQLIADACEAADKAPKKAPVKKAD